MSLGIIGGTGLYRLAGGEWEPAIVDTPYGTATVRQGVVADQAVVFKARHGEDHSWPPHQINHRANLAAFQQLGVTHVVGTSACGTLAQRIPPGSLALLSDFIDQTRGGPTTFFDDRVVHLDMSEPYCRRLRDELQQAAAALDLPLIDGALYVCTSGPRFETPAEIRAYASWGAELVGMTNAPEAVLAREAELAYAAVAVATNWAAGLSGERLTHAEVEAMMAQRMADLTRLLTAFAQRHRPTDCPCRHALDEARRRGVL